MNNARSNLDRGVLTQLADLESKVQNAAFATLVWQQLSSDDQNVLGGEFSVAWKRYGGTVGMASYLWGCHPEVTIVRLCDEFSLLRKKQLENLADAVQADTILARRPSSWPIPIWRRDGLQLHFRGQVIRKCENESETAVVILDAFQRAGWPARINYPIEHADDQRIREHIYRLRQGLTLIDFKPSHGGIRWEVLAAAQLPR